jgi:hypothetical protein
MQGPQIRAVIDLVRRNGLAVPMTGQKHNLIVVYASKSERPGRFAIGGPDNLPVRYFQAGELGHPGATYDCEHSCVSVDEELFGLKHRATG